ncbi:uncharacterized protein LOC142226428 [Haematobia irritans]|uniref:uncharacterized protein LOC142226428 n=1 Tax=Haematobia irritans TaxID=7368 RepID=UPI003F501D45
MELKSNLWSLLVILSIFQVSHGQLMCYVCENCPDPRMAEMPIETCDESFFDSTTTTTTSTTMTTTTKSTTTTMSSSSTTTPMTTESTSTTVTTTESPSSTESSTETDTTTTTEMITTTEEDSTTESTEDTTITTEEDSTSTTETAPTPTPTPTLSTEASTTTVSTTSTTVEDLPPSPPTPPTISTSSVPTPPTPGAANPIDDLTNETVKERSTSKNYVTSSEFRVRQMRAVSEYTYHCYKVLANINGTMITNRGCSRVKTMESVCGLWKEQHPEEELNKCYPCSNTKCNGSATLNVSISAILMVLIAGLLQRH